MEVCAGYGQPGSGREEGGRISNQEGGRKDGKIIGKKGEELEIKNEK